MPTSPSYCFDALLRAVRASVNGGCFQENLLFGADRGLNLRGVRDAAGAFPRSLGENLCCKRSPVALVYRGTDWVVVSCNKRRFEESSLRHVLLDEYQQSS